MIDHDLTVQFSVTKDGNWIGLIRIGAMAEAMNFNVSELAMISARYFMANLCGYGTFDGERVEAMAAKFDLVAADAPTIRRR